MKYHETSQHQTAGIAIGAQKPALSVSQHSPGLLDAGSIRVNAALDII